MSPVYTQSSLRKIVLAVQLSLMLLRSLLNKGLAANNVGAERKKRCTSLDPGQNQSHEPVGYKDEKIRGNFCALRLLHFSPIAKVLLGFLKETNLRKFKKMHTE